MVFRFSPSTPFIPRVQQPSTALREAIGANRRDARDQQRIDLQRVAQDRGHERATRAQDFAQDVDAYGRAERADERAYARRAEQVATAHKAMEARRTHMMKAEAAAQDRENRGDVEGAARIRETARRMIPAAPAPVLAPGAGLPGSPLAYRGASAPGAAFSPAPPTSAGSGETLAEALSSFDREGRITDEDLLNADKGPDPYEAAKEDAGGALASVDSALAAPRTEASRTEQGGYNFSEFTRSKMEAARKRWQAAATGDAGTPNSRKAAAVVARLQPEIYQESERDSKVAEERSQAMFKALQGNYHPKRGGRGGGAGGGSWNQRWKQFSKARTRLSADEPMKELRDKVGFYEGLTGALELIDKDGNNPATLSAVIFRNARALNGSGALSNTDVKASFEGVDSVQSLLAKGEAWILRELKKPKASGLVKNLRASIAGRRAIIRQEIESRARALRRQNETTPEEFRTYEDTERAGLDAALAPVEQERVKEKAARAAEDEVFEELGL